jgi:nucleoside-diphosphate-sugar epimerase
MKRILITGGAGSIGSQVTRLLVERGNWVRVFDLPICDFGPLETLERVEIVPGDITDPATVRAAADRVDVVLHLAALLPPVSERDRDKTYAVNVLGTQNIVDTLAAADDHPRLIFSSTVATYGNTMDDDPPIRVDHAQSAVDLYGETKIEAERLLLKAGIPYTILRISGVVIPALLEPPDPWPFMRDQRMEFINRADVVQALLASVEQEGATNAIFNIAGGESWRMRGHEYVAQVYELLDVPIEEASYRQTPWWSDWYDTTASQAVLGYQQTSFPAFLEQLDQAIMKALGW